MLAVKHIQ